MTNHLNDLIIICDHCSTQHRTVAEVRACDKGWKPKAVTVIFGIQEVK